MKFLDEKFLLSLMTEAPSYVSQYPRINEYNVFSISKLSWNIKDQIDWKLGWRKVNHEWTNLRMAKGKIIHEYLQNKLDRYAGWAFEQERLIHIPYRWHNRPFTEIVLMGHIDGINYLTQEILEIKTSDYSDKIQSWHINQASAYWLAEIAISKIDHDTGIYKINSNGRLKILSLDEKLNGATEIYKRAIKCAQVLDGVKSQ